MTTEIEMTTQDTSYTPKIPDAPRQITGLGTRLCAAREALQMSQKEAAARLHLAPRFVICMENEDFENGLPATFMRGYIRSYGRLLNIPPKELDTAIEKLGMQIETNPLASVITAPPLNPPLFDNNERYIRWFTYFIVVVLVALMALWWTSRPHTAKTTTDAEQIKVNSPQVPAAVPSQGAPTHPQTNAPITAQPPVNSVGKQEAHLKTSSSASPSSTVPAYAELKHDKHIDTQNKMVQPEPELNTLD